MCLKTLKTLQKSIVKPIRSTQTSKRKTLPSSLSIFILTAIYSVLSLPHFVSTTVYSEGQHTFFVFKYCFCFLKFAMLFFFFFLGYELKNMS